MPDSVLSDLTEATYPLTGAEEIYLTQSGNPRRAKMAAARPDRLWLPPQVFTARTGSPAISTNNEAPVWLFDGASSEIITGIVQFPPGWATYKVILYWSIVSSSGGVTWRWDYKSAADAGTFTTAVTTGTLIAITAPAAGTLKVSTIEASLTVPSDRSMHIVNLVRLPADAGDTVTVDAAVLGVLLERVT